MVICYWRYGNSMVGNKHSVKCLKFFPKLHKICVVHSQHSTAPKSKCIFNVLSLKLVIFFLNSSNKRSLSTLPHEINLHHKNICLSKYYHEYMKGGNRHSRLKNKNEDTKCRKNTLTLK